jgi:MFS family permease
MMVVIFFGFGLSIGVVLAHIVLHAVGLGISATNAASILATIGALSVAGRIIFGIAGDRIGNKKALIICSVLMSASLLWALVATELVMLYLFAVFFGLSYGGVPTLQSSTLAEQFGLISHGVILGVTELAVTAGETIGPVLAGYIFDVSSSYNLSFVICAAASFVSFVLVLQLKPVNLQERSTARA